ncbi:type VI secretion system baseplate subunit TssE [uncultured Azohydromonas sp.]|uniref:type VI secretion system baseplate subunit TssE n=1 Tax=uncultured Azohydromonas sp. TaxID=487342 RepID=UPI002624B41B|nr:type VI secretion system baseplate subunit TssE [uncultured Azohydromonas sp.]
MDRFVPSLLDKLLGTPQEQPGASAQGVDIAQIKAAVARDIETLLNTRPGYRPSQLSGFEQATHSLLTFGLVDISPLSLASDRDRGAIVRAITRALLDHEPRLRGVKVAVREGMPTCAGLCFTIHAQLQLQRSSEPVAFDAVLQPGSNRYAVTSGGAGARVAP